MIPVAVFVLVFVPMMVEAALSRRNERTLRAIGAQEPRDDVYAAMQVAYPAAFLAMILEAMWRQPPLGSVFGAGLVVFALAKGLKYWAIATLGMRWTFRVLVPRGAASVTSGPYRFHRHPNYIAVTGELLGAALMSHAAITGPLATIGFVLLIKRRITVEERALMRNAER